MPSRESACLNPVPVARCTKCDTGETPLGTGPDPAARRSALRSSREHHDAGPCDPALWRGRYRPENTLIIESSKDDCIPPDSREALFYATGEPERIVYPYNHWQPFLSMTPVGRNVLTRDIFEFLDRKLLQPHSKTYLGSHQLTSADESR